MSERKELFRIVIEDLPDDDNTYSYLRDLIAAAVEDAGGTLVSINYEGSPDPYLFDDPDNLPEDLS